MKLFYLFLVLIIIYFAVMFNVYKDMCVKQYEINNISIIRNFYGTEKIIEQFSPENTKNFEFEDHDLISGKYIYTAELTLDNGSKITSDSLSLFFADSKTVIAFPNPVQNGDFINILNDYTGGVLQLVDNKGNLVREYDLVSLVESLDLVGLNKGNYYFRIIFEDRIVSTGKIVKV